mmetsp:Transcript_4805/g.10765  ORF Transcript_4805/g.10765 Transcript_4805/m.10765 type:complete len:421 (-) Transcript_4805:243-1505(-)
MNKSRPKDQRTQLNQVAPLVQAIPSRARNAALVRLVTNANRRVALVIYLRVRSVQNGALRNLEELQAKVFVVLFFGIQGIIGKVVNDERSDWFFHDTSILPEPSIVCYRESARLVLSEAEKSICWLRDRCTCVKHVLEHTKHRWIPLGPLDALLFAGQDIRTVYPIPQKLGSERERNAQTKFGAVHRSAERDPDDPQLVALAVKARECVTAQGLSGHERHPRDAPVLVQHPRKVGRALVAHAVEDHVDALPVRHAVRRDPIGTGMEPVGGKLGVLVVEDLGPDAFELVCGVEGHVLGAVDAGSATVFVKDGGVHVLPVVPATIVAVVVAAATLVVQAVNVEGQGRRRTGRLVNLALLQKAGVPSRDARVAGGRGDKLEKGFGEAEFDALAVSRGSIFDGILVLHMHAGGSFLIALFVVGG